MRRLSSNLVGIDQGELILFSDFEDDGPMWTGNGAREARVPIVFSEKFKTAPIVQVIMNMWDASSTTTFRGDIRAEHVSETGCDIVFRTWGDTKIARVSAAWTATGELPNDDDWSLY